MLTHGQPSTLAEVDELIERVRIARNEAVAFCNPALIAEADDDLARLHAFRAAVLDGIPEQRKP